MQIRLDVCFFSIERIFSAFLSLSHVADLMPLNFHSSLSATRFGDDLISELLQGVSSEFGTMCDGMVERMVSTEFA